MLNDDGAPYDRVEALSNDDQLALLCRVLDALLDWGNDTTQDAATLDREFGRRTLEAFVEKGVIEL